MYSTNLTVSKDGVSLFTPDNECRGVAYGWEDKVLTAKPTMPRPTQTAKDNALLWSCAPDLVEALAYCVETLETLCPDTAGTPAALNARVILDKLVFAMKPASVAADG